MRRWAAAALAILLTGIAGGPVKAIGLAFLLFVVWLVVVLVRPIRKCTWCAGTLRAKKHRWFGRTGRCRKCLNRGGHKRFGATTVHRIVWAMRGDDGRRARLEEAMTTEGDSDVQDWRTTVPEQRRGTDWRGATERGWEAVEPEHEHERG